TRGDAAQGAVQLPVRATDLRRSPARPTLVGRARPARPQAAVGDRNLSMAATTPDFEQAGELKIGQVGIANLRIRKLDIGQLAEEMRERVRSAPKLFDRAAMILDFGGLTRTPDADATRQLLSALRDAGVLPVAIAYGTSEIEALAKAVGL